MQTQTIQINKLPEGWEIKKLGDVTDFLDHLRKPVNEKERRKRLEKAKEKYPYYGANGQVGWIDDYIFDEDLVLLAEDGGFFGSIDKPIAYRISGKTWVNNHAHVLRPKEDILIGYLHYFLMLNNITQFISGTTRDKLNQNQARKILIILPPLPTQQKIVSKLDAFFSHYNRLKEEKRKAKQNYEKILQSAIGSFLLKGKWKKERLGNVCIINPKKSEIKDMPQNLDVSFIPMNAVDETEGVIKKQEIRKLKDVKKGYTYFKENDVLFAKITPCMENGKAVISTNLKNGIGFGSTEFHVIRPNENMLADYIFYFIRQPSFRKEAAAKMSGTAGQLRVPSGFLENYEIPIPPTEEQKRIIKILSKIKENSRLIYDEQSNIVSNLSQLPKAVLSKAFNGELT